LSLDVQASLSQCVRKKVFIDRFKKSRADITMDGEAAVDCDAGQALNVAHPAALLPDGIGAPEARQFSSLLRSFV
jgi:hypothetical protein